jgi:quercetin dioxygenase-like cupin family protein
MVKDLASPTHSFSYEGVVVNVYHANKGEGLSRHSHTFNHATICHNGSCMVRIWGPVTSLEKVFTKHTGGANLLTGESHEIEALEDGTVFVNIFNDKDIAQAMEDYKKLAEKNKESENG